MTVDAEALPRIQAPAARRRRPLWSTVLHWFGMACLMVAAGVAGYIGWLLWGTGLETKAAQADLKQGFEQVVDTAAPETAPPPGVVPLRGSAYAELIIPRIDLDMIVVQGTDTESLKKGPGHYPDTAHPWDETGRVGIAGHRTTYLAPFHDLEAMEVGDPITLRTEYGTFDYRVTEVFVIPSEGSGVVLGQTARPSLVLTTCHPKYASYQRLIVTADRV
jgi:sortase A